MALRSAGNRDSIASRQPSMRAAKASAVNLRIDTATRSVWLSEILSFYNVGFVPAHGVNLIAFANRFVEQPAPLDYAIRFTPYDWTIANSARSR